MVVVVGDPNNPDRSNTVREHRRHARLTQAQFAEQCSVSRQTIVAAEASDYAPSVYLALRMAEVLDTTVEALFAPHRLAATDSKEEATR